MKTHGKGLSAATPLVQTSGMTVRTDCGRILFEGLTMAMGRERAALIGRNGVGKSTLLHILAGRGRPASGRLILRTLPYLVEQQDDWTREAAHELGSLLDRADGAGELSAAGLPARERLVDSAGLSLGERRKARLLSAKLAHPQFLILDEPTQDLDEAGVEWLNGWLSRFQGGLLVASHDPALLESFENFLLLTESGGRCLHGSMGTLMTELQREEDSARGRYFSALNRLIEREEKTIHIARRRARKRQFGRVRELGRATPRARLNQKRDYAQVKHGRMKQVREARVRAARETTKAARRSVRVDLHVNLPPPALPPSPQAAVVLLTGVSAWAGGRALFERLDLALNRERVAVIGRNGAGKTTLLDIVAGRRAPDAGTAAIQGSRIGRIAQGGTDWLRDESLAELLTWEGSVATMTELWDILSGHGFPPALARRPLKSLSPGERVRAALIVLFRRPAPPEVLVLDEPTYCLDLTGRADLIRALNAWGGGLIVASHDRRFLEALRLGETIRLGE